MMLLFLSLLLLLLLLFFVNAVVVIVVVNALLLLLQSYLLHLQQAVVPAFKLFFLVVNTTGMGLESHFLKVASHHRRKRKLPCEPALFPCRRLIWSDYDKHKETCTIPLFHKTEIERRDPQAFHPPIEKNEIWLLFCFLFYLLFASDDRVLPAACWKISWHLASQLYPLQIQN